jgi:hypothetical protein
VKLEKYWDEEMIMVRRGLKDKIVAVAVGGVGGKNRFVVGSELEWGVRWLKTGS